MSASGVGSWVGSLVCLVCCAQNHDTCHFCTFLVDHRPTVPNETRKKLRYLRYLPPKKNSHRYQTWPYSTGVPPIPRPIILGVQPFVFGGVYYLPAQYDRSLWPMRWFTRMYVCSQLRVLGNHSGHSASSMLV